MRSRAALPRAIEGDVALYLAEQAVHVSSEIESARVTEDGQFLEFEHSSSAPELPSMVARFVNDFVKRFRAKEGDEILHHPRRDSGPILGDVFSELQRRGWAMQLGPGQIGLSGPALRLAQALDSDIRELALRDFQATEHQYPTLIPAVVLERCDYFTSFPHLATVVSHFSEDYEMLSRVRTANQNGEGPVFPDGSVVTPVACMTPATCYHCYQALAGTSLSGPGQVFTAVGRCARFESKNMVGLERLWEFTMREVILVGGEEWVAEQRERLLAKIPSLFERWDVECRVETANDPFFTPVFASKAFWQSQSKLKYEMRLTIDSDPPRSVSAGSLNLHQGFFGETFDIRMDSGEPVFTGCVAFGVERWVLALFAQHGFEPKRWSEALRERVFG